MEFIFLLVVVVFLFLILNTQHGTSTRQMRKQALEADQLLTRAESKLLLGEDSEADTLYCLALDKATSAGADLLASEALYGLARIANKHGNFVSAEQFLERALQHSVSWSGEKPNFEHLLRAELESTRRKVQTANT